MLNILRSVRAVHSMCIDWWILCTGRLLVLVLNTFFFFVLNTLSTMKFFIKRFGQSYCITLQISVLMAPAFSMLLPCACTYRSKFWHGGRSGWTDLNTDPNFVGWFLLCQCCMCIHFYGLSAQASAQRTALICHLKESLSLECYEISNWSLFLKHSNLLILTVIGAWRVCS